MATMWQKIDIGIWHMILTNMWQKIIIDITYATWFLPLVWHSIMLPSTNSWHKTQLLDISLYYISYWWMDGSTQQVTRHASATILWAGWLLISVLVHALKSDNFKRFRCSKLFWWLTSRIPTLPYECCCEFQLSKRNQCSKDWRRHISTPSLYCPRLFLVAGKRLRDI